MRSSYPSKIFFCLVFVSFILGFIAQLRAEFFPDVVFPQDDPVFYSTCVRNCELADGCDTGWKNYLFPMWIDHSLKQSSYVLTENDELMIDTAALDFTQCQLLTFDSTFSQTGNNLYLDGFIFFNSFKPDPNSSTYWPNEGNYFKRIGKMKSGTYNLTLRRISASQDVASVIMQSPDSYAAFKADPQGFADAQSLGVCISTETLTFTVVPEPSTCLALGLGLCAIGFVRRRSL